LNQLSQKIFVDACKGLQTAFTPIWLNRQAGRYMPEYHAVKGTTNSLDFFVNPDLAAKVTLDAQRILGVDAAIMFADLLPILVPMGLDLEYQPGVGPVFANPVRTPEDVAVLRALDAREGTGYIAQTVTNILDDLPPAVALIGFGAAPFTLASYAIEGRGSRNYVHVKKMMYLACDAWHALMTKLTDALVGYLQLQIDAGVDAIQLFDSWVGCLSEADFRRYALPHTKRLIDALRGQVPIIYFGTGNAHLLPAVAEAKPDVIAFDWRTPLVPTWEALGCTAVQGNLDPIVLCADAATVSSQAAAVLNEVGGRPGHIFNLGHGIIPETPVDLVKHLVDCVHEQSAR
jgi:uroporphyrinogen decarboxylase